jgi:antitoxin MazE
MTEVTMKTRIQKWGNSLALRIPKSFAEEAGLHEDASVELSLAEGKLVVQPILTQPLTLAELLRGITDENLPGEWDTGPAVGKEVW